MNLNNREIASLSRIGGRICLDFVNTVGGRELSVSENKPSSYIVVGEKIVHYYDLLAWGQTTNLLSQSQIQELLEESQKAGEDRLQAIVTQAIGLREAIYKICKAIINKNAPTELDLLLLNQTLSIAYKHAKLIFDGKEFSWDYSKLSLDKILWLVADSAAELFTTADLTRLRECGGNGCCWLFEDTSKNKMRQWCDMQTCGNLAKVRRFRSKVTKIPKLET
ncbi:MAG: CGNR zinc finger domain-containing protein [Acidobacteria bacterium]|nr:CGNR zinc finger domain-containing protein [Acidobacteriota bacterium]